MSVWIDNLPKQDESNLLAKIKLLSDPHPKHATRAAYFKEAALKLEAQQAACKN